ncbi:hypothetical protein [Streptomyces bicolor]|uniref:hypothetical protein n=1 Tax=Streptomyces bicolor TaxID=66874 RepID=UPI0004E13A86|nr:hypothetical protein [Streptomyces bicolor]
MDQPCPPPEPAPAPPAAEAPEPAAGREQAWTALTAVALIIVIGALTCALLTLILVPDRTTAATTAGLVATTGITSAATLLRRT